MAELGKVLYVIHTTQQFFKKYCDATIFQKILCCANVLHNTIFCQKYCVVRHLHNTFVVQLFH